MPNSLTLCAFNLYVYCAGTPTHINSCSLDTLDKSLLQDFKRRLKEDKKSSLQALTLGDLADTESYEELLTIKSYPPSLQCLTLNMTLLTDEQLATLCTVLVEASPGLKTLILRGVNNVGKNTLEALQAICEKPNCQLVRLDLTLCNAPASAVLAMLASHKKLRVATEQAKWIVFNHKAYLGRVKAKLDYDEIISPLCEQKSFTTDTSSKDSAAEIISDNSSDIQAEPCDSGRLYSIAP
jgi:hypothetical protein